MDNILMIECHTSLGRPFFLMHLSIVPFQTKFSPFLKLSSYLPPNDNCLDTNIEMLFASGFISQEIFFSILLGNSLGPFASSKISNISFEGGVPNLFPITTPKIETIKPPKKG